VRRRASRGRSGWRFDPGAATGEELLADRYSAAASNRLLTGKVVDSAGAGDAGGGADVISIDTPW